MAQGEHILFEIRVAMYLFSVLPQLKKIISLPPTPIPIKKILYPLLAQGEHFLIQICVVTYLFVLHQPKKSSLCPLPPEKKKKKNNKKL